MQQNHSTLRLLIIFDINIVRDSPCSLRMMQKLPDETSNVETDTTWRQDTHETKSGFNRRKHVLLVTAVAFSDLFGNCHKFQGYLNCISNDDRIDRYERHLADVI